MKAVRKGHIRSQNENGWEPGVETDHHGSCLVSGAHPQG